MEKAKLYITILCLVGGVVYCQEFQCPRDPTTGVCTNGTFPNDNNCETYFRCVLCQVIVEPCPPGWHFNPYELACMEPFQAECDASFVEGSLFCVAATESSDGPLDIVPFDDVLVNELNPYSPSQHRVTYKAGTYFMHMSAGISPGKTVDYGIDDPLNARVYSTYPGHPIDVQTRDIIFNITEEMKLNMSLAEGTSVYGSNTTRPTMWSAFRLEDFMEPMIAFSAVSTTSLTGLGDFMKFDDILVNAGDGYDPSTGYFTAPLDGKYFFSFTSGVHTDSFLNVVFDSIPVSRGGVVRTARSADPYIDTVSRSLLFHLNAGDYIVMNRQSSDAIKMQENSIGFSGFYYSPINGSASWAVYREDIHLPAPVVDFNIIMPNDNENGTYDVNTDMVNITKSGFYVITISGGVFSNNALHMSLRSSLDGDESMIMAIHRDAPAGDEYSEVDMISRTVIVHLRLGELVWVSVEAPGLLFSNANRLASFSGFLLYDKREPSRSDSRK